MRFRVLNFGFWVVLVAALACLGSSPLHAGETTATPSAASPAPETATLQAIYTEALSRAEAYDNLVELVSRHPGRLSGSQALTDSLGWAERKLQALGLDRVYSQEVMVPHWERGAAESAELLVGEARHRLSICALGGSGASPDGGVTAEVVEVDSLEALQSLSREQVAGKLVFFNGRMNPALLKPGAAYAAAGPQRTRGAAAASRLGARGVLVRSLTFLQDDVPHTGTTIFPPDVERIPAVAVSTLAADRLSAAIRAGNASGTPARVALTVNARWLPDAPSRNVIGEIRGTEFPDEIIVVAGHMDSWDIAPGAHDDGAGIVQSIEVLRLFRTLGIKPRHTLRCVVFVNEENGSAGALRYATEAKDAGEKHIFAIETDSGGFEPKGFALGSTHLNAAARAERWRPLLAPFGLVDFRAGRGGMDVVPLMAQGATVGDLVTDSQRYFDIHHTREDTIDKVNPRELHLGAAALATLVWLVDTQGL